MILACSENYFCSPFCALRCSPQYPTSERWRNPQPKPHGIQNPRPFTSPERERSIIGLAVGTCRKARAKRPSKRRKRTDTLRARFVALRHETRPFHSKLCWISLIPQLQRFSLTQSPQWIPALLALFRAGVAVAWRLAPPTEEAQDNQAQESIEREGNP
jgi:hypothetical protein